MTGDGNLLKIYFQFNVYETYGLIFEKYIFWFIKKLPFGAQKIFNSYNYDQNKMTLKF